MNWFQRHLDGTLALYWFAMCIFVSTAHAIPVTSYSIPVSSTLEGIFFESIRLIVSLSVFSVILGIIPAIIINGGTATEPFTAYNILVFIISLILSSIVLGWVIRQKGRRLAWLILLIVPFGLLVCSRLKNKRANIS